MPTDNPLMAAARNLARRGFSVFPLRVNDKRPAIENWQNLATTDLSQIDKWWTDSPQANIGVTTGPLLVVDVDPRNGGSESLAALLLTEEFTKTATSRTQGGGAHIIYALPEHTVVRGGANKLGKGVDIKSFGGYIVAPGSAIDGRPYAWANDFDIAIAPEWLVARCKAPRARDANAGVRIMEEDQAGIELAQAWLAKHAPTASEGGRDDTAYKVAAKLYDYGISLETCHDMLAEWAFNCTYPPMSHEDIERISYSAQRNRSKSVGAAHPDAPGFEPVEIAARSAENVMVNAASTTRGALYYLSYKLAASTALDQDSDPLIEGLLDRLALSVWYGDSNAGKTFVMLDAAWHIAAGKAWATMPVRQGAVAYVAAEGGRGILKRVRALHDRYPEAGDVPLFIIPCPVDLLHHGADLNPLVAQIREIAREAGCNVELIVIDTLSRAMAGGNENDSADMGIFVGHLDAMRNAIGAHVAVIHHTGKDKAKGARGHSLLRAATDTEVEIDSRRITVTKQRDMEGDLALSFTLRAARLGVARNGRAVTSCTLDIRPPGSRPEQVALQPRLSDLVDEIDEALKSDKTARFGWQFTAEKLADIEPDKVLKRPAVLRLLSELSEKGWIKKVGPNQWVRVMSGMSESVIL